LPCRRPNRTNIRNFPLIPVPPRHVGAEQTEITQLRDRARPRRTRLARIEAIKLQLAQLELLTARHPSRRSAPAWLSAMMYARRCASVRYEASMHGTSVMPSLRAASTRPWPAMPLSPGAPLPAISCLGAFQTPAARACGEFVTAGVRKPAQRRTSCIAALARQFISYGLWCALAAVAPPQSEPGLARSP
jgi:hypothetical protein